MAYDNADKSDATHDDTDRQDVREDEEAPLQIDADGRPDGQESESVETTDTAHESDAVPSDEKDEETFDADRYLRLAAEFDNYKKRTAREYGTIIRTANIRLLQSLVDIVDNFERALNTEVSEDNGKAYRKGVELIHNQLVELLKKENVTPLVAVGEPFNPAYHEAIMQAASEEYDEGIVCQEIQKGYTIEDRVLRHARVVVSSGRSENDTVADKNEQS